MTGIEILLKKICDSLVLKNCMKFLETIKLSMHRNTKIKSFMIVIKRPTKIFCMFHQ